MATDPMDDPSGAAGADPTSAPQTGPTSPDDEAKMAFASSQASAQQRGQVQAAFDTMRNRRAFVSGILTAKGKNAGAQQERAFRESSLGQNLEGAPPASQTP